jgi:2-oxoisovalerate dehydrogenase E1 component
MIPTLSRKPVGLDPTLSMYRVIYLARLMDRSEVDFVNRGDAFFHVSSAGHEAVAVLARHLIPEDLLHCHYRDKALMLARGVPLVQFFHSVLCNAAAHSAGRQMSAHLCDRGRNVLSIVGPVGNQALQAVGVAAEIMGRAGEPIVVCSMGDGTSQQGEVLEAIAEAVRWGLPVLFVVHDNRYSISTRTGGMTFFSLPDGKPDSFYGLPLRRVNGRDAMKADETFGVVVAQMRRDRKPAIVVMEVERLSDHTNADDETVYRSAEEIAAARASGDPIVILRRKLIESGVAESELAKIEREVREEVRIAAEEALAAPEPEAVFTAKRELREDAETGGRGDGENGHEPHRPSPRHPVSASPRLPAGEARLTMAEAIRETLRARMKSDDRVTLYGEDIEDPKGDVFGVTKGLTIAFPGRVRNSPVSESTIVGRSIGRALAGGRPVAFIQFADFLPLAFNQIATEMGSMYWRTDGAWECPVIVMIACGGYRPGLGPFHSHTLESIACHVPGVDVVMVSNAADAAGALNAAFESGRPTLFFYPKALLNDPDLGTSADVEKQWCGVGRSRLRRSGTDLTFIAWGNTVGLCGKAAEALTTVGMTADVIDLCWLSPWDQSAACESARRTGKLIIVHEDNHTCGFGAEVVATVAEKCGSVVRCRRVTRPDVYVPCNFANQLDVLPSYKRVLTTAAEMLDLDLTWELPAEPEAGITTICSTGSSPSDESTIIVSFKLVAGQRIAEGDLVACLDCDKALFDLASPVSGTIEHVYVQPGQTIRVGTPMVDVRTEGAGQRRKRVTREESGTPRLKRR